MSTWENHADAAVVDMTAARMKQKEDKSAALEHLRDAETNLEKAIEALEDEVSQDDSQDD